MHQDSICHDWRPVVGYESDYEVNSQGLVRSLKNRTKGYFMEQRKDRAGYWTVRLNRKDRKSSTQYVHRILAKAFIPNPEGKCCVNHISGDKLDNRLENLEWASHRENALHAYEIGLSSRASQMQEVFDYVNDIIFKSIKEAAQFYNIPYATLKQKLRGYRKNDTSLLLLT